MITGADALLLVHLNERMKVGRLVEVLEQLPFNSRDEGKLVLDRVVRNYLVHASQAVAGDPAQTIHDALAWRGPAMNARRFPPPWSVE